MCPRLPDPDLVAWSDIDEAVGTTLHGGVGTIDSELHVDGRTNKDSMRTAKGLAVQKFWIRTSHGNYDLAGMFSLYRTVERNMLRDTVVTYYTVTFNGVPVARRKYETTDPDRLGVLIESINADIGEMK